MNWRNWRWAITYWLYEYVHGLREAWAAGVESLDTSLGRAEAEYEVSEPSTTSSSGVVDEAGPAPTPGGAGHPLSTPNGHRRIR